MKELSCVILRRTFLIYKKYNYDLKKKTSSQAGFFIIFSLSFSTPGKESATPRERPKAYETTLRVKTGCRVIVEGIYSLLD